MFLSSRSTNGDAAAIAARVLKPAEMVAAEAEQSVLQARLDPLSRERGEKHGRLVHHSFVHSLSGNEQNALRARIVELDAEIRTLQQRLQVLARVIAAQHRPAYGAAVCLALATLRRTLDVIRSIACLEASAAQLKVTGDVIRSAGGSALECPVVINLPALSEMAAAVVRATEQDRASSKGQA